MIIAHLSDLHLGFRAYGRVERGVDVRERDVAAAFEKAVLSGVDPLRISVFASEYSSNVYERGTEKQFVKKFNNWMAAKPWEDEEDEDFDVTNFWADFGKRTLSGEI